MMVDILGYEGKYRITEDGRVISYAVDASGKEMTIRVKKDGPNKGYCSVGLRKEGKQVTESIHRLVAIAYIPNPLNLPEVNHIDFDRTNNDKSNLQWSSHADNCAHSAMYARYNNPKGENQHLAKVTEADVRIIRSCGLKHADIAQLFSITRLSVSNIINKRTWKHVL